MAEIGLNQMKLSDLSTPCLVIDKTKLTRNIDNMAARMKQHAVSFRPHLKTCKSIDVARLFGERIHGITVSTLKEAQYFIRHGMQDILYGVGIAPDKFPAVAEFVRQGADIKIIVDDPNTARMAADFGEANETVFNVLIEIDCDGCRAGIDPEDAILLETARTLHERDGTSLIGVMAHGGGSYACETTDAIVAHAEQERSLTVRAADRLREAGMPCPIVSVGSTPTATFAEKFDGVTEVRAGVFVFQDLDQVSLGVCGISDIALTVMATVIGHKPKFNRLIVDAGGLALSKDRGIAYRASDLGYGLVTHAGSDRLLEDLVVEAASQEHGIITSRSKKIDFDAFPIGRQLRILPNHVCMTAAAHDGYYVVDGGGDVIDQWGRVNGW